MGINILVLGESGSGKSTSIRTLNPKETFIIKFINKPLPFPKGGENYKNVSQELNEKEVKGNCYMALPWSGENSYPLIHIKIARIISYINKKRPDIKNLILDDFQYMMSNEFFSRATEKNYDKFTESGQHTWQILEQLSFLREDLTTFVLTHSEKKDDGTIKMKTIGRMLDEKDTPEGRFVMVFHAFVKEKRYIFLTNRIENIVAKTPLGMFKEMYIPNDLQFILNTINEYFCDVPDLTIKNTKEVKKCSNI